MAYASVPIGTTEYRHRIPWGHAGIEATVRHMRRIGRRGAADEDVRARAREIAAGARSAESAAHRIRRYLHERVAFEFDPPGVELVRTPAYLVEKIAAQGYAAGDCDDVAVLGAALGMALGLPARYVLVGLTPSEPFEHVYAELGTPSGWVELDTTKPAQMPPGVTVHRTGIREA